MTCADIDDLMTSGAEDLLQAPAAREHLEMCTGCRLLVQALEEIGRSAPLGGPTADRLRAIEAAIKAKIRPVRPLASASVFLFVSIVIFVGVVMVGMMASGTKGWSVLNAPQGIAVLAAVATGAVALAISMTGQMAPGNKCVAEPIGLLCAILLALLLTISSTFHPTQEVGFIANGLPCMNKGLTVSLAAGLLLLLLLRRGAARSPYVFGATAGGLAGLSGLSALELTCPNVDLFHVLAWHCSEVLICASAGALLCATVESYRGTKKGLDF